MSKFPAFHSIGSLSIDFSDSTSRNAIIYGNGRNQVAITIKLTLLDENTHNVRVPEATLQEAVYLCDYRTGEKIPNDNKNSEFFYSKEKNDYCQSVSWTKTAHSPENSNSNFTTVKLYVSASSFSDGKLISCGIHIDGFGDVDTSENGTTTKLPNKDTYFHQNFVTVKALEKFNYSMTASEEFKKPQIESKSENRGRGSVTYGEQVTGTGPISYYTKDFPCSYNNSYINVEYGIKNAKIYNYNSDDDKKWICIYDSENNNQYMIVAHSYDDVKTQGTFGLKNTAHWNIYLPVWIARSAEFDLTQNINFNEWPKKICFTRMAFCSNDAWELLDGQDLEKPNFNLKPWFEFYDTYGNYGKFNVDFKDKHEDIKITDL